MQSNTKLQNFMRTLIVLGSICILISLYNFPYYKIEIFLVVLFIFTVGISSRITIQIPKFRSFIALSDTFIFFALIYYGGEVAVILAAVEAFLSS
jgi:hypothetical protein